MIRTDRITKAGKPVGAQPFGQPAFDPVNQAGAVIDQRSVQLYQ